MKLTIHSWTNPETTEVLTATDTSILSDPREANQALIVLDLRYGLHEMGKYGAIIDFVEIAEGELYATAMEGDRPLPGLILKGQETDLMFVDPDYLANDLASGRLALMTE